VGSLSLAVELYAKIFSTPSELVEFCKTKLDYLVSSRPTAVNMKKAADYLQAFTKAFFSDAALTVDVEAVKQK
jgi:methylthioribose-1-phosphate isomerase